MLVKRTEDDRTTMLRLTVLAAGAVETGRTVAELGGSLTTMAAVEANTIAAHSCTGRVWTSTMVEKDRRGEKKKTTTSVTKAETPGPCLQMSACRTQSVFLSRPYRQTVHARAEGECRSSSIHTNYSV